MEGEILLFSLLNQNTLHSNERPNAPQTHNHYDYPVTLAALLTAPWPQVPLLLPYQHGITCSLHHGYKFPLPLTLQGESSSVYDQWMNSTLLE